MPTYVVERYVPRSTSGNLRSEGEKVAQAARELTGADTESVAYLSSVYIPDDEVSFCLFDGSSAETIAACFEQAQVAFDRVLEAEVLKP